MNNDFPMILGWLSDDSDDSDDSDEKPAAKKTTKPTPAQQTRENLRKLRSKTVTDKKATNAANAAAAKKKADAKKKTNAKKKTDANKKPEDLNDYSLYAGTSWFFVNPQMHQSLDYLFIDEAGQVSLANTLAMSTSTKNIVLIGDQMQLSQPIKGTHPGIAGKSSLEYLVIL